MWSNNYMNGWLVEFGNYDHLLMHLVPVLLEMMLPFLTPFLFLDIIY